ncbi:MAG: hypothetical protein FWH20_11335, partial [Oscillospiraceae bacterium]|nr:hypothetical protein [Oscillospiraceae bacterium]
PLKTALLWVFSILLFFSLGFGTHLYLSQGVFDGYVDSIAADSLDAVLRRIPADSRYEAYEIYVSREPDITECIIFGVVMRELQNPEPSHYRLVITNNNRANATLYNPFNQAEYDRLVTGTSEERLHADTMMHHYERFLQSADEINANNPRWKRANTEKINSRLTK